MNLKEFLKPLNGIRGIGAVVIAYFYHYNHFVSTKEHPLYKIFSYLCKDGFMAVELFFFLSGITFLALYSARIRGGMSGEEYAIKRFSRLWPVHIVTLVIVAFVQMLRKLAGLEQFRFPSNDLYHFILNIFMLQNSGLEMGASYNWVSWTLTVNIILYTVFYWICKKTKDEKGIFNISILFILLGGEMIHGRWSFVFFSSNIGRGFFSFFWGVIFIIIYKKIKDSHKVDFILLFLFLFCCLIGNVFTIDLSGNSNRRGAVLTITLFTFLVFISMKWKWIRLFFCTSIMQWLGSISFSLFMIHCPVQMTLITINDFFDLGWDYSRIYFWIAYVAISFSMTILLYKLIELPCSKYIRRKYYHSSLEVIDEKKSD